MRPRIADSGDALRQAVEWNAANTAAHFPNRQWHKWSTNRPVSIGASARHNDPVGGGDTNDVTVRHLRTVGTWCTTPRLGLHKTTGGLTLPAIDGSRRGRDLLGRVRVEGVNHRQGGVTRSVPPSDGVVGLGHAPQRGNHIGSLHRRTTGENAVRLTGTHGVRHVGVPFTRRGASVRDSRTVVLTWQQLLILVDPVYPP